MTETRRALIVMHPDFDNDGKAGVQAALACGEQIQTFFATLVDAAIAQKLPAEDVRAIREHVAEFEFFVEHIEVEPDDHT
jgi:hypothetical protein